MEDDTKASCAQEKSKDEDVRSRMGGGGGGGEVLTVFVIWKARFDQGSLGKVKSSAGSHSKQRVLCRVIGAG